MVLSTATALAAVSQLSAEVPPDAAAPSTPPSILLITIDTLRHDHLQFTGYGRDTAPFLTSLAEEGTVFRNAHSTSSWTVPAVASMLTGVYPTSHGATHGVLRKGEVIDQEVLPQALTSLASTLQGAGYQTYAVVANGHIDAEYGFARGFDRFRCLGFARAEDVNAAAIDWADEITSNARPILLWLHYFDPHQPYQPHQPWLSRFLPDITPVEHNVISRLRTLAQARRMVLRGTPRNLQLARALYDSEISYCDDKIRHLFADLPVLDAFLTIVTSDHGEEFLEHDRAGHGKNLHSETVRVPLLVRPPGGGPRRVCDSTVSLVDLAPTLAAIGGAELQPGWIGCPVFDAAGAPVTRAPRRLLAELDRVKPTSISTAIGARWKVILDRESGKAQLYDLSRDPDEHRDLAADQPDRLAMLLDELEQQLAALPGPGENPSRRPVSPDREAELRALGYVE